MYLVTPLRLLQLRISAIFERNGIGNGFAWLVGEWCGWYLADGMVSAPSPGTDASRVRTELHADMICDAVSNGTTIAQVCRDLDIARFQIYAWIEADEDFASRMEAARAAGYDALADEALEIADDSTQDTLENGKINREWVARSKLRFEARLKLLSKWHPKRYGEKLEIESVSKVANVAISDDPNEAARQYADLIAGKG